MKYSVWDPREDRRDGEDDDEDDRYNNNYTVSEQYWTLNIPITTR